MHRQAEITPQIKMWKSTGKSYSLLLLRGYRNTCLLTGNGKDLKQPYISSIKKALGLGDNSGVYEKQGDHYKNCWGKVSWKLLLVQLLSVL